MKETLGKNIHSYRKAAGLTQGELAKKLNVSQEMVALYESGQNNPSVDKLIIIAKTLSVSTDLLLGIDKSDVEKPKNPKLWKIFEKVDNLPAHEKSVLIKMIEGLLSQRK
jgi:transcriptional regulator with XRE-family HTH domain